MFRLEDSSGHGSHYPNHALYPGAIPVPVGRYCLKACVDVRVEAPTICRYSTTANETASTT